MRSNHIKIGISPIAWSNDDLHDMGAHITFEQCIAEMAQAGYLGCEVGHKFPKDPGILQQALSRYQLTVASAWQSLYFTEENGWDRTINNFQTHMAFLKAMGAQVIVVCECGHSIHTANLPLLHHSPEFNETQWNSLINGLHEIGQLAQANGMSIVYHHHMGTGIETQDEIYRLMNDTDPEVVSLLLDTGHLACSGGDVFSLIEHHGDRIRHVHLKDIRYKVLQRLKSEKLSFLDAVRAGLFTVPGDGAIEFSGILKKLFLSGYHGWWIIEAEQDPDKAQPLEYALKAQSFLRDFFMRERD